MPPCHYLQSFAVIAIASLVIWHTTQRHFAGLIQQYENELDHHDTLRTDSSAVESKLNAKIDELSTEIGLLKGVVKIEPKPVPENLEGLQKKIAFLFLIQGKVPLAEHWVSFFLGHKELYSIYVHSKQSFPLQVIHPFFQDHVIPAVSSGYGSTSMVEALLQLLLYAFHDDMANFKFIFISDSTVAVKPFPFIYDKLVANDKTSFCFASHRQALLAWDFFEKRDNRGNNRTQLLLSKSKMKAELWSILWRGHVSVLLANIRTLRNWIHYPENDVNGMLGYGAPDELVFPSLLFQLGLHTEKDLNFDPEMIKRNGAKAGAQVPPLGYNYNTYVHQG